MKHWKLGLIGFNSPLFTLLKKINTGNLVELVIE